MKLNAYTPDLIAATGVTDEPTLRAIESVMREGKTSLDWMTSAQLRKEAKLSHQVVQLMLAEGSTLDEIAS